MKANEVEIGLTDEGRRALTPDEATEEGRPTIKLARLKLAAGGKSIVAPNDRAPEAARFDKPLLRAVVRANRWRELLESGMARSAYDLARHEGCRVSYVQRHLPPAFLAPSVIEAIVNGRPPRAWTLSELIGDQMPLSWTGNHPR